MSAKLLYNNKLIEEKMETKYYEYIGTQKQADRYEEPIPIIGNIYPDDAIIGGRELSFWLIKTSLGKEWKLVGEELSTQDLIQLLNKQAAKDGMICLVAFKKKPGIEITDFHLRKADTNSLTRVVFNVNLEFLEIENKKHQLIESIKNVFKND